MGELGQQAAQSSLETLSDGRLEPGSINILPAKYPGSIAPGDFSPENAATVIIDKFNKALAAKDYSSVSSLFTDQSYWRDHLCLTWDLRTLHGPDKVLDIIQNECRLTEVSLDSAVPHMAPQTSPIDVAGKVNTIQFFILISTAIGKGRGFVRLTQLNGEWKILTLFTTLKSLYDVDEPRGSHRPYGKERGTSKNWLEKRNAEKNFEDDEPAVLIIGKQEDSFQLPICD